MIPHNRFLASCAMTAALVMSPTVMAKKVTSPDDVLGSYKIISTKYGFDRALVKSYKDKSGKYFFKITKVLKNDGVEDITHCQKCPGGFKDKPVKGMIVVWGLEPITSKPGSFKNGYGISPWSGRMFRGDLKVTSNGKIVRIKAYPLGTKLVSRQFNFLRISDKEYKRLYNK